MPKYEAPGVYVEETSFRSKSVEAQRTAGSAFVGPTARGPEDPDELPILTSFADFTRHYGGVEDIGPPGAEAVNYLALAARVFFSGAGARLQVARTAVGASASDYAAALARLGDTAEVELIAAPGASALPGDLPDQITRMLIDHVGEHEHRFAVLDPPPNLAMADIRAFRADYDSQRAALYYPWVIAADPRAPDGRAVIALPPSGFVCAVYARSDIQEGVWAAPANEQVIGAVGLQANVNAAKQEVLNPIGVNCIRQFAGRGIRIWGARTISSDPEFKYVNVRRLVSHIEVSLDRGLKWAVFEANGERLWAALAEAAQAFLYNLWLNGGLPGAKPEEAFFVRCDRSTMSAADIAAGQVICMVGVAVVKPAEFIIFRIRQPSADAAA